MKRFFDRIDHQEYSSWEIFHLLDVLIFTSLGFLLGLFFTFTIFY